MLSRPPPQKALPSRWPGTAWARIIFQPLDCQWFGVARSPKRKRLDPARRSRLSTKFWQRSSGRMGMRLDNAFNMRAEVHSQSRAEVPTADAAGLGVKRRGREILSK